jgi:hypothetical protein
MISLLFVNFAEGLFCQSSLHVIAAKGVKMMVAPAAATTSWDIE